MQQQNMNFQSQQQGILQTPPSVVSTKDSLYLTDMLSWNLLAMKKAHFFAQQCQDQELKMEIENCGRMHQKHYEKILTHLNSPQNQMNPQVPGRQ
ncbi:MULTISPECIES: hypothetical protein [Mesobacillus]|uniref:Spore coat protein n=2 Tax=Mesobacillus TaxID=2675231 RepID=A0A0D6ZDC5_9BACI|nr:MULTISPECIES: hypothetical protein [Mesobacillus]KIY23270.1 hypothetical protein UB32_03575 [Mesobacillus subterraneus]MDQ0412631.1 hypothetical protein [Mesobacillus stamsii]